MFYPPRPRIPPVYRAKQVGPGVFCLSLVLAATCLRSPAAAPSTVPATAGDASYVIAHVDAVPTFTGPALALLEGYAATCRRAPGMRRCEVLREVGRPNHYTLVEVWDSEALRQANEAAATTRRFREQLYPMLGSPFDGRLQQLARP